MIERRCDRCKFSEGSGQRLIGYGPPEPGRSMTSNPTFAPRLVCKESPPGKVEVFPMDWCYKWRACK